MLTINALAKRGCYVEPSNIDIFQMRALIGMLIFPLERAFHFKIWTARTSRLRVAPFLCNQEFHNMYYIHEPIRILTLIRAASNATAPLSQYLNLGVWYL